MLMCYYVIMVPKTAHVVVRNGIYGYNAMGTCVAVGGDIFYHSDVPNTIVAILGAALTVLMQVIG
jgi:urea transporter